ncbi:minichromosome maintenance domain-containing protein 2-like [Xenia sp. Carnegie-2017]|uniref:minichromosome maintenance domain-containing protein 2-like n=1 Tax=Xenia sp. Carnegie-2017 TaxID=2897299 RepID=UPI001F03F916|nr:minichromosome maintenance domain-containing protein 2-like [Xenia sp. Carnegie-2017]
MNFPLPALKSMTSIAEAHAKLSLRSEVTEDDAVVAILLYEECITARLGYSVLGVRQFHHFKNDTLASFINIQNEKLSQMKRQMKRFCHLHSNYKHASSSINREE